MDPVTIEKLKVDSLGKDQRPVKYVIEYVTTCSIKQNEGEPPVALKQIELNEPGRYSWSGEDVDISIVHNDGFCKRSDSTQKFTLKMCAFRQRTCSSAKDADLRLPRDAWGLDGFITACDVSA